jgi:twitching motility protein PilI
VGFRLGSERFVVPRDEVREVLMVPPAITRVPGAKSWVRGLANVRGHLLPLVDLREFLGSGVGGTERSTRPWWRNSQLPVGLVVDGSLASGVSWTGTGRRGAGHAIRHRFLAGCFRRGGKCGRYSA